MSLRRADHSPRGVLPSVVCLSVWVWSVRVCECDPPECECDPSECVSVIRMSVSVIRLSLWVWSVWMWVWSVWVCECDPSECVSVIRLNVWVRSVWVCECDPSECVSVIRLSVWVWSWNLDNGEILAHCGLSLYTQNITQQKWKHELDFTLLINEVLRNCIKEDYFWLFGNTESIQVLYEINVTQYINALNPYQ